MNVDVYRAIAEYLREIQDEVIWPTVGEPPQKKHDHTPAYRPDLLWLIRLNLMKWYVRATEIFPPPPSRTKCKCTTDSDCKQDQICVQGECVSTLKSFSGERQKCSIDEQCPQDEICVGGYCEPIAPHVLSFGQKCSIDEQCPQDEICVGGICIPEPWEEEYTPVPDGNAQDLVQPGLREAIDSYFGRIHKVLTAGLAARQTRLGAVRDMLMHARVDAMKIAGIRAKCEVSADVPRDHVCIRGVPVKVPFRLSFRARGSQPPAPWTAR